MRFVAHPALLLRFIVLAALLASGSAAAAGETSSTDAKANRKGLQVVSSGGNFKLKLSGRLQVDAVQHDSDTSELKDDVDIRRARVALKATLFKDWAIKAQADFSDGDASVKDLYVRYSGWKRSEITAGNFKEPFSLEEQTSSKNITFLERSLPVDAFSPGRAVGIAWHRGTKRGSTVVGLFGEPISGSNDLDGQGFGFATRITRAVERKGGALFHFGASGEYREPRQGESIRFDAKPESALTNERFVRTRRLRGVSGITSYGLESAMTAGPVSLQGEVIFADVARRDGRSDVSLNGWYTFISWFPTGESRPYEASDGTFGQVHPQRKWGALELALRYSSLDLDHPSADGGTEENVTLAVNWYLKKNLRLMANYVQVDSNRRGKESSPGIFLVRAQVVF